MIPSDLPEQKRGEREKGETGMKNSNQIKGHLLALVCVAVWGSSFVISKGLMEHLLPVQLMLARFILAYGALWIVCPRWYVNPKEELHFLLMAIFANTLYYWAENTAITLTQTTNVSILVSTAPIMTALMLAAIQKGKVLTRNQTIGFAIAFLGVVLVVLNGALSLKIQPAGDLLALLAAVSWASYGILLRRWGTGHDDVLVARKLMFYGIVTGLPLALTAGQPVDFTALLTWKNGISLAYLAFVGNALCYICWGGAVRKIGVLSANLYLYMIPLVTLVISFLALGETITVMGAAGMVLVTAGMICATMLPEKK